MSSRAKSARRGASPPLKSPKFHADRATRTGTPTSPGVFEEEVDTSAFDGLTAAKLAPDVSREEGLRKRMESLPEAGSRWQLSEYREQLVREMAARGGSGSTQPPSAGPKRPSPIQEETTTLSPTPESSEPATTSTESGNTIRGGVTPSVTTRTPSYPFPRMATPGFMPPSIHRPFTTLSPTGPQPSAQTGQEQQQHQENFTPYEKLLSNPSTPASAMTFLPGGASPRAAGDNFDFPSPNLYELALMLTAEPGLDAWWNTVVHIMKDYYKAERITLAIPADSTDVENVPWGQKATYNSQEKDALSLAYLARGSSLIASSTDDNSLRMMTTSPPPGVNRSGLPLRPGLQNRHSFTSYEDKKEQKDLNEIGQLPLRPEIPRSKSTYPISMLRNEAAAENASPPISLNQRALEEHDAADERIPSWEVPSGPHPDAQGRVLPVLQALDYEADPLIDHNGVQRVLDRGKVVALTRTYPYLDLESEENQEGRARVKRSRSSERSRKGTTKKSMHPDPSAAKLSTILGGANRAKDSKSGDRRRTTNSRSQFEEDLPRPPTPRYEEYEQAPPSPWSQSPAPSPAIRSDPKENPFFTDAMVDEESFNPGSLPQNYTGLRPPEAIGVDNSWTVLHVPLIHPLLSVPPPSFRLDPSSIEQRSRSRDPPTTAMPSPDPTTRPARQVPIAILSILSPIIPYPSNLRYSIQHLAAHLATSFSLCRHYTNLEAEIAGLHRRRPESGGFGGVGPDGRPLGPATSLTDLSCLQSEDLNAQRSMGGSMTSPSDISGPSRSTAGSPSGTPGWETSALGFVLEKRGMAASPSHVPGDSYFNTKPVANHGWTPTTPGGSQRARRNSREISAAERRASLKPSGSKVHIYEPGIASPDVGGQPDKVGNLQEKTSDEAVLGATLQPRSASRESLPLELKLGKAAATAAASQASATDIGQRAGSVSSSTPGQAGHRHKQLHSYGADFTATFQSLPQSSSVSVKNTPQAAPSRTGSISSGQMEMPPPSDRLKSLILDSLPAHVFVALPHTGAIVWVNSRYLSYRGQTAERLAEDPWGSIHPDDRDDYLRAWSHSVRSGDAFSKTVRIRRFDGVYRWFQARAVATRDKRGIMTQFLGSYMDIHDQHIAELKAARQEEIEASEAKHRLLANLIPQIIFTATEDEGITFANEQWLLYTGQSFEDSLGLGFMDFVHPDDLARCKIPLSRSARSASRSVNGRLAESAPQSPREGETAAGGTPGSSSATDILYRSIRQGLSRQSSSGSSSASDALANDLHELARKGIIKITIDSSKRLSYTTEVRLRHTSGEYRWHLVRCVEIDNIDFGNGASSYFGSATDINDHKLLEAKLKEAMESKSRFLSNMSHEIRTPLIGISGMVSFLQDTTLNEEQRDYTNTIQTSANSLLMIINDILDLSKVDAGMMKLNFEWFHTRSLIEDVNELVSTMAIAKRLELNYIVEADVPAWVKGDRVRIRQVLLNVIGNAIKFTAEGEVFSRCRVAQGGIDLDENEIMLEFSVVDTGRGFTKEEAELIFKPFSQIDGSSTRQHGGSGLGLVISRQLVELHGGKMEGSAVPGEGSTFTFTAKFGLPTDADHPDMPASPRESVSTHPYSEELGPTHVFRSFPALKPPQTTPTTGSPTTDPEFVSPPAASSGSSNLSTRSARTQTTAQSSVASVNVAGLVRFSEAARASGQDISQMKLEIPSISNSSLSTPTSNNPSMLPAPTTRPAANFRPPMYSILVICPQKHSRDATTQHIEMTLPKDVPHQITAVATLAEAQELVGHEDPVVFTHIVINLPSSEEIIGLVDRLEQSTMLSKAVIIILSDSVQRQAIMRLAAGTKYETLLSESRITYIYKPVKPSRFAVIFDPAQERDLSIDRNRYSAQRIVESQKQSYVDMEKRVGNKGYKVLLVEDNPVNQKVLRKYLKKVGVDVDVAADGVECIEKVFSQDHRHYSVILCDLHMPRKDGYQACRDIRKWEAEHGYPGMPIIALSANVMSDVQEKCVAAGFNDYVTKPVDFIELSKALSKFF